MIRIYFTPPLSFWLASIHFDEPDNNKRAKKQTEVEMEKDPRALNGVAEDWPL